jgi:hypothetical protein
MICGLNLIQNILTNNNAPAKYMCVDAVQLGPTAGGTLTSKIVLFLPWSENLCFPVIQQSTKQRWEYYRQTTIICLLDSFEKDRFTVLTSQNAAHLKYTA